MFILHHLLMYMLSFDVSLRRKKPNDPGWRNSLDPFCSRAMLICSTVLLGKADVAGCCSAGSVLR